MHISAKIVKAITYQLKAFKISLNVLNRINEVQVFKGGVIIPNPKIPLLPVAMPLRPIISSISCH